jgi:hypothetical protein
MTLRLETEFPDYDVKTLPPIPDGWLDTSWHNNSAPSFESNGYNVWIDYLDPALRECNEGARFIVHKLDDDGAFKDGDPVIVTDDWDAVLAVVTG